MGKQAEDAGVEILTGCAASDVVTDTHGTILGVLTQDMGVAKDGAKKDSYMPGAQITARVTMFAEGARGSLSEVQPSLLYCCKHIPCHRLPARVQ